MAERRLHVRCPGCDGELVVDAAIGEVLSHGEAKRAPAGGKDFDSLLKGLDESKARAASPLWQVDASAAPALLLHGDADNTVPYAQSVAFARRLREAGVRAELYTEPGAQHGFFNRSPYYERTLPVMERFLLDAL